MFSLLLVLFVVLGLSILLFLVILLLNPKSTTFADDDASILIVKLIESHREILPVNSVHGWNLVLSNCSLRCWKKELSFTILGSPIIVYGCTKEINCPPVVLLNVIADISTWPEWDAQTCEHPVHLELPEDPLLHGDAYMQCDQLVLTSSTLNVKTDVIMYRFGNLEENGTGWILLWNAKKLDWILYIAQPVENKLTGTEINNKCVLTAIWGFDPSHIINQNVPEILCNKILYLSQAISFSHLKIRPFLQLMHKSSLNTPHLPTIHSALNDLPESPCELLHKTHRTSFKSHVLAVVPLASHRPVTAKNIWGFGLVSRSLKSSRSSIVNGEPQTSEERYRSRRRHKLQNESLCSGFPRIKLVENRRSSSLSTPLRKKLPELTITEAEDLSQIPQRTASHSFLDILFQKRRSSDTSDKKSRSPSPRRNSTPTHESIKIPLEKSTSLSSQELSPRFSFEQNISDASDVEKDSLPCPYILKDEIHDRKKLSDYCFFALINESFHASLVEMNASEEEQKKQSGGWIFKEVYKDVTILKKTKSFRSSLITSYLCKGIIQTSHNTVWEAICNPQTRYMYDDTVKKIMIKKEYEEGEKLIYMYNECITLLHKEIQDFCLLQCEQKNSNEFILGFHSVEDESCPLVKDVVRGKMLASGWIIKPLPDDACHVSYLVQMVVRTPEMNYMEEICNVQPQCISNLSSYLSTKPITYTHVYNGTPAC